MPISIDVNATIYDDNNNNYNYNDGDLMNENDM
jgi:hypothetical protein